MLKYIKVTGKIRSRDNYWENQWNPENGIYELKCFQVLRVEYTVNGYVYTHNFYGVDDHGEIDEDYEFYCQKDAPENVKSITDWKKLGLIQRIILMFHTVYK